jgi:hypothetical protein
MHWTTISIMSIHNPSTPPNSVTPVLAYDDGTVIVADATHGRGPLFEETGISWAKAVDLVSLRRRRVRPALIGHRAATNEEAL